MGHSLITSDDWAADHQMNTHARQKLANPIRAELRHRFHLRFRGHGADKWPLKTSIAYDVMTRCPDLDPDHVRIAIADYCNGLKYLTALLDIGRPRRDLAGNQAGEVSRRDAWQARRRLERLKANNARQAGRRAVASSPVALI